VTSGPIKPMAELLLNSKTPIASSVVTALPLHITESGSLNGGNRGHCCGFHSAD